MKKTKLLSTFTLILILAFTVLITNFTITVAHDPPQTHRTYAYVNVSPNPVGVNQEAIIIFFLNIHPPTASGIGGDRWRDMTIEVTKPDGSVDTLGPFNSDPVGSAYTLYTPTQVGTYNVKFDFPGQVLSWTGPTGEPPGDPGYLTGRGMDVFVNDTFTGSSAETTLIVQQEPIEKIEYPLPNEYWTRPIEGQNTNWASQISHWLSGAHLNHPILWQQHGLAPNTAHIMWTKPLEFGGVVGGVTSIPGADFYSGGSYEGRFQNSIIMYGNLYYRLPNGNDGSGGGTACVNLRTGETIWEKDITVDFGQLYQYESFNQHGVIPSGYLWDTSGSTWTAYDALTGKMLFSMTNVPGYSHNQLPDRSNIVYAPDTMIKIYEFDYDAGWVAMWSTEAKPDSPLVRTPGSGSNAYQYRPVGKEVDMGDNYIWNVSLPDLSGEGNPTLLWVLHDDLMFGSSAAWPSFRQWGTPETYTLWAVSLKPGSRGQLLWKKTYSGPADVTRRLRVVDPVNRVFLQAEDETFKWLGYSLDTGDLLWGPVGDDDFNAFQLYGGGEGNGQIGYAAYGNLYVQGYGGEIHCYDTLTGNLEWEYSGTSSIETAWGYTPIFISAIADGKVYAFNNEHSPNTPYYKGEKIYCLDAFTGKELWTLMGWSGQTGGRGTSTAVLADGYLCYYNYYDNQVYSIGKGPSQTTLEVAPKVIPKDSSVLIEGMVLDKSPGTKQNEQATRFPNGVPAIADEYMSEWMEYLYMQKPCPEQTIGVQVKLTAVDPNGNSVDVGTVTSDGYGVFKKMWTPEIEGEYTIVATFDGSESYWTSYAETALGVGPAITPVTPIEPEEPTEPEEPVLPLISTEVAIVLAVGAIALVGIVIFWVLRKRQ
jgi:outer membrane protein assembly factor BamB